LFFDDVLRTGDEDEEEDDEDEEDEDDEDNGKIWFGDTDEVIGFCFCGKMAFCGVELFDKEP
jgi:hypothetical protein